MTTYAENHLTISGSRRDLEAFRDKAIGIDESYRSEKYNRLCFQRLVPMPKHIDQSDDDIDYGEWRKQNWGCDWEADLTTSFLFCDEAGWGQLVYEFLTADGVPDRLIEKVSATYPRLLFTLIVTDESGFAALFMARWGKLAKCFGEPYHYYMYGDAVFHGRGPDVGPGNWQFFSSPERRPSDEPPEEGLFDNNDFSKPSQSEGDPE
jgi:hypothetical protein